MKLGILTYFDLFRLPIYLYSEGYTKRSSIVGLLFSFGIYVFILFSFLQSDIFRKTSPSVVTQSNQIQHAKAINFNDDVLMYFAVSDVSGKKYMDESIFSIQFLYHQSLSTKIVSKTLVPCKVTDVDFNHSLFESLSLNGSFCLQNKSFILEGSWGEDAINYVVVNLKECNNETSPVKCKSRQEIDGFFRNPLLPKYFAVLYHNAQIDFYDYNFPIKISYRVDTQAIDPNFRKISSIYLENAEITTDDGTFFSSLNTQSNFMFQLKESDFMSRNNDLDPYEQIFFYASKEEIKCTRKYQKLPEILGSLAGTTHFIMFFGFLVCNLKTYISILETLSNRLYVFSQIKKGKKKKKNVGENHTSSKMKMNFSNPSQTFSMKEKPNYLQPITKTNRLKGHSLTKLNNFCPENLSGSVAPLTYFQKQFQQSAFN